MLTKYKLIMASLFYLIPALTMAKQVYPKHWWQPVIDNNTPDWEILPQAGVKNKTVILSKRNELGILSNFAATPFVFNNKRYNSVEGLWQSMKYPELLTDGPDPRANLNYKYTRSEVTQMVSFKAKTAGDLGTINMKKLRINWVSFNGQKMIYRTDKKGVHYSLIKDILREKLNQNPEVKKILLSTGDLILLPDHKTGDNPPPAWQYYNIWMEIRDETKYAHILNN